MVVVYSNWLLLFQNALIFKDPPLLQNCLVGMHQYREYKVLINLLKTVLLYRRRLYCEGIKPTSLNLHDFSCKSKLGFKPPADLF